MTPEQEHELFAQLLAEGVPWWMAREAIATIKLEQADFPDRRRDGR